MPLSRRPGVGPPIQCRAKIRGRLGGKPFEREVRAGDPLIVTTQLLEFDARKIHYFHRLYHAAEGYLAATHDLLSLHVSRDTRRVSAMPPALLERLETTDVRLDGLA